MLTPEQIKNWRDALVSKYGMAACLITDEQIQELRDHVQSMVDARTTKSEENHDQQQEQA